VRVLRRGSGGGACLRRGGGSEGERGRGKGEVRNGSQRGKEGELGGGGMGRRSGRGR